MMSAFTSCWRVNGSWDVSKRHCHVRWPPIALRRAGLLDLPRLMGMIRVYFERLPLGTRTALAVEGDRPHTERMGKL